MIDTGYDDKNINRRLTAPSQEVQRFAELFKPMLDLQVSQRHIRFLEGSEDIMQTRVESLAQKAIALFIATSDMPSSTDSSSARSRHHTSLLSGSYAHLSTQPTSREHHSTSESQSTLARSYGFSADLSSTPTGAHMHDRTASSSGPAYLDMQPIPSGDYSQHTMTSPLPNQRHDRSSYSVRLPESVEPFVSHDFNGQTMGQSAEHIFPIEFQNPSFDNFNPSGNMLSNSFDATVEDATGCWESIDASQSLQYEHGHQ
jgi:hypothetical protein